MKTIQISMRTAIAVVALAGAMVLGGVLRSASLAKSMTPSAAATITPSARIPGNVALTEGFAPVVRNVAPAVVNISSAKLIKTQAPDSPFSADPFFRQFFGGDSRIPRERREKSLGSGVIVNGDGYLLTNNHVVEDATDITVTLLDKREFKARIVGRDAHTDVAVLKIDAKGLPSLPFGDSSQLQVGDLALAVGDPFGVGQTVTMGIVSAVGRGGLGIEDYEDFIQTDAAINPGNSGGALVNARGELVGINTAIISGGGGNQGVGFAIPANMARTVMDQLMKNGKVVRAQLGILLQDVTPEISKAFGLNERQGVLVGDVVPNSPAARSGIERGDIILQVDGQPVIDRNQLRLKISMMAPGSEVALKIFRGGSERDVTVRLSELTSKEESSDNSASSDSTLSGVQVDELTSDAARELQLPPATKGVVVTEVNPSSAAAEAGLRSGDVIQEVNRKPVSSVPAYESAIHQKTDGQILLLVNRGGNTFFVVIGGR